MQPGDEVEFRFPEDEQPEANLIDAAQRLINEVSSKTKADCKLGDFAGVLGNMIATDPHIEILWPELFEITDALKEALDEYSDTADLA